MAKLASSDMHTLDAQYHLKCLVDVYNWARNSDSKVKTGSSSSSEVSAETVALVELAAYCISMSSQTKSKPPCLNSDLAKINDARLPTDEFQIQNHQKLTQPGST